MDNAGDSFAHDEGVMQAAQMLGDWLAVRVFQVRRRVSLDPVGSGLLTGPSQRIAAIGTPLVREGRMHGSIYSGVGIKPSWPVLVRDGDVMML